MPRASVALLLLLLLLLPAVASAQVDVRQPGAEVRRIERLIEMSGVRADWAAVPFRDRRRVYPNPRHSYPDVYEYVPTRDPLERDASAKADEPQDPRDPAWEESQLEGYRFSRPSEDDGFRSTNAYADDPARDLVENHRYRYRNAYRHWAPSDDLFHRSYPYGRFDIRSDRGAARR